MARPSLVPAMMAVAGGGSGQLIARSAPASFVYTPALLLLLLLLRMLLLRMLLLLCTTRCDAE